MRDITIFIFLMCAAFAAGMLIELYKRGKK